MKNIGLVGIVMLVMLSSFPLGSGLPLENQPQHSRHIITVDDEPGDADSTSIKEALNHSSPGDTIEVFSGTYNEHGISITVKGISLIGIPHELGNGSDIGKPFINGQGLYTVLIVDVSNVTISGFNIENRGIGDWFIICLNANADRCTISNNNLRYSGNSIIECESSYNKITNDTIRYPSGLYGIMIGHHHNTVSNNIIDNCPRGISFWGASFNTITRNRISNCSEFGIDIGNDWNVFEYNTIENNVYGLHINLASWSRIQHNNFINNTVQAGFDQGLGFTSGNRFIQNYWNQSRFLPYPIRGTVFLVVPWVLFDWRPAQTPYDITPSSNG
jgi:parallel beta-helix repeat protein